VLKPGGALILSSPLAQPRMSAFIGEQAAAVGWWQTGPLLLRLAALVAIKFSRLFFVCLRQEPGEQPEQRQIGAGVDHERDARKVRHFAQHG